MEWVNRSRGRCKSTLHSAALVQQQYEREICFPFINFIILFFFSFFKVNNDDFVAVFLSTFYSLHNREFCFFLVRLNWGIAMLWAPPLRGWLRQKQIDFEKRHLN